MNIDENPCKVGGNAAKIAKLRTAMVEVAVLVDVDDVVVVVAVVDRDEKDIMGISIVVGERGR
jgi:serine/threonine protein kinase HipA of HipAB toxin-antitoxin module